MATAHQIRNLISQIKSGSVRPRVRARCATRRGAPSRPQVARIAGILEVDRLGPGRENGEDFDGGGAFPFALPWALL